MRRPDVAFEAPSEVFHAEANVHAVQVMGASRLDWRRRSKTEV